MRTLIKILFLMAFLANALCSKAQVSVYEAPIDCVQIDRESYRDDMYIANFIHFDSIDVNGLYRGGSTYFLDSMFTSNPYRRQTDYDENRRKIHYQEWVDNKGIKKIYTNESFTYTSSGLLFTHKLSKPFDYTSAINDSMLYTSFDSILEKYTDYYSVYNGINYHSRLKETYDYYPNHKLYQYQRHAMDSTGWKYITSIRYLYSNNFSIPDTVYKDTVRYLYFKDELGRDTLQISNGNSSYLYHPMERYVYSANKTEHFVYYGIHLDDNDYRKEWTYTTGNRIECTFYAEYGGGSFGACYYYYPNGRMKSYFTNSNSTMDGGPSSDHSFSYKVIAPLIESDFDFNIYPNPAISSIDLLCRFDESGSYTYLIYDNLGQLARSGELELQKGVTHLSIALNGISRGFYFLRFTDGRRSITKKLIVQE